MANGSEQIEARLVAYIDGVLSEKERAELEAYFAAHPDHRALVQELRSHKLQLGMLPREKAPLEVMDHLQGHLERQALLENVDEAASSMRINRWPQFGAVAALLMLTAGLGVLIYQVLPGTDRREMVLAPGNMQQLPTAPSLDEKGDVREPNPGAAESATAPFSKVAGGNREDFVDRAAAEMERNQADKAATDKTVADKGSADKALAAEDKSLTLNNGSAIVVSTDDPMITQNLLARYLSQNEIPYEPVRADVLARSGAMSTTDQVVKAAMQSPPVEPIGSMVEKVNRRQRSLAEAEMYVVARNVSVRQAEEINTILNTQRGARQQATYYDNANLSSATDVTTKNESAGSVGSQAGVSHLDPEAAKAKAAGDDASKPSIASTGGGGGTNAARGDTGETVASGGNVAKAGERSPNTVVKTDPEALASNANVNSGATAHTSADTNKPGGDAKVPATTQSSDAPSAPKPAGGVHSEAGVPAPAAVKPREQTGGDPTAEEVRAMTERERQEDASQQFATAQQAPTTAPTTQSSVAAEPRTDVLIVLRAEVAGAAQNDGLPTTQPLGGAATQPATRPSTQPSASSTTQPAMQWFVPQQGSAPGR